jgi:hypothetical protein
VKRSLNQAVAELGRVLTNEKGRIDELAEKLADRHNLLVASHGQRVGLHENLEQIYRRLRKDHEQLQEEHRDLVESHEQLEAASVRNRDLCGLFSRYLHFSWTEFTNGDTVQDYVEILERELDSEHRSLRLGLCATAVAWSQIRESFARRIDGNGLIQGLRLSSVLAGLEELTARLENLASPDELWESGIRSGFSQDWMHDLFRAELVLESFYNRNSAHQDLEDAIGLAAVTLRLAMSRLGKGIESVELLRPFPSQPPPGWARPRFGADQELRTLPEVNRRVRELLETDSDNFIVDVESFRLRGDSEHAGECRVVVVNPAEWRQA